jgi:hypothetical protein
MKKLLERMSPFRKFILLHVAVYGLESVLTRLLAEWELLWDLFIGLAGCALGIVAIARLGRDGASPWRLLGSCVLALLGSIFAWMFLGFLARDLLEKTFKEVDLRYWVGLRFLALPYFTAGCLAYFRLIPFRMRPKPTPSASSG